MIPSIPPMEQWPQDALEAWEVLWDIRNVKRRHRALPEVHYLTGAEDNARNRWWNAIVKQMEESHDR